MRPSGRRKKKKKKKKNGISFNWSVYTSSPSIRMRFHQFEPLVRSVVNVSNTYRRFAGPLKIPRRLPPCDASNLKPLPLLYIVYPFLRFFVFVFNILFMNWKAAAKAQRHRSGLTIINFVCVCVCVVAGIVRHLYALYITASNYNHRLN